MPAPNIVDPYSGYFQYLGDPAKRAQAVVVGTLFANLCRGIYVGGAGDVTVELYDGTTVTFTAVPAGSILPIRASRVTAASATNMVAFL